MGESAADRPRASPLPLLERAATTTTPPARPPPRTMIKMDFPRRPVSPAASPHDIFQPPLAMAMPDDDRYAFMPPMAEDFSLLAAPPRLCLLTSRAANSRAGCHLSRAARVTRLQPEDAIRNSRVDINTPRPTARRAAMMPRAPRAMIADLLLKISRHLEGHF